MTTRETVDVDGVPISYLTAGKGGPLVLLLHGTYWSRVWQPVLEGIAAAGLRPVAVDFPGFGRSGGELTVSEASVPRLSAWLVRFIEALGHKGPVMVAGHDIGGGVAQHLMLAGAVEVPRVAGERHHVRFVASTRRCPLPGSCSGGRDDAGRCSGRASNIRREGPWALRERSRDH